MAVTPDEAANPRSLADIHSSVRIPQTWWRRFLAFSGPALMVSVGYMDPGNWGTDLAAGSQFRYRLLWVLLMSNLMALLLQTLATRLGVVTGHDLAQACREVYPRRTVMGLWGLTEIAIAATDLAEVIGTIIGLKLLLGVPYLWGLAIAAGDTFLLLALQRRGIRLLELVTLGLVGVIGGSFFFEIVLARPDWAGVLRGFVPGLDSTNYGDSLYVAIGMLGATVMPHNLYLHSALVQTRAFPQNDQGKRLACKYNFFDSLLSLNVAFFINAAILILAATAFTHKVDTLQEAHATLRHVWGIELASVLFAVALIASGQSSTLTGTMAGQVVMEGFVNLRLRPWVRRLLTRSAAIVPAVLVLALAGQPTTEDQQEIAVAAVVPLSAGNPLGAVVSVAAGQETWKTDPIDKRLLQLLILSQVLLSFQLPFAIIPLVQLTSDQRKMGSFASGPLLSAGLDLRRGGGLPQRRADLFVDDRLGRGDREDRAEPAVDSCHRWAGGASGGRLPGLGDGVSVSETARAEGADADSPARAHRGSLSPGGGGGGVHRRRRPGAGARHGPGAGAWRAAGADSCGGRRGRIAVRPGHGRPGEPAGPRGDGRAGGACAGGGP